MIPLVSFVFSASKLCNYSCVNDDKVSFCPTVSASYRLHSGAGSETAEECPQVERGASHLMNAPSQAAAGVHSLGITLHKCICISSYKLFLIKKEFNEK